MLYEEIFFICLVLISLSSVSYADGLTNAAKFQTGGNFLRARLDFFNMTAVGVQNLSVVVTDNQDVAIANATVIGTIDLPNGTSTAITFAEKNTGNYTFNYSFDKIGDYDISVTVSKTDFPTIIGSKKIYVGLIQFVSFSGAASVFQGTTAFFDLTVKNTGNVPSQVIPNLFILDASNNLVFSKAGFVSTLSSNSSVTLLQRNTLTWNVGSTATGTYTAKASIKFTDENNNTVFTPNRTVSFQIQAEAAAAVAAATTSAGGGAVPVPEETRSFAVVTVGETIIMKSERVDIPVQEIQFKPTITSSDVRITASLSSLPAGTAAPVTASVGSVYKYIKIESNKPEVIGSAKIRFSVPNSWITGNNIEPSTAVLKRFSAGWEDLPTRLVDSDGINYFYESEATGFSLFAIAGKRKAVLPELLQFVSVPILVEVNRGRQYSETIVIHNPTPDDIENIKVTIEGIPENWYDINRPIFNVDANSEAFVTIFFSIPNDAPPGNYQPRIIFTNAGFIRDAIFVLRINGIIAEQTQTPEAIKKIYVNERRGETQFVMTVINVDKPVESLSIVETIDKSIAAHVNDIVFSTPPTRIIRADPIVEWTLDKLAPNEQRNITYYVKKVINKTAPFVYSSIEQIATLERIEKPAPFVQIEVQITETTIFGVVIIAIIIVIAVYRIRSRKIKERVKEAKRFLIGNK